MTSDVTAFDRLVRPARRLGDKVYSRIRVRLTGDPYPSVMSAGPLRPEQVQEIKRLGYTLRQD